MSRGIRQIELQSLSNDYQRQVFGYNTEVSSFTPCGPCRVEIFTDKRGETGERQAFLRGHPHLRSMSVTPPSKNLTRLLRGPQASSGQAATSPDLPTLRGAPNMPVWEVLPGLSHSPSPQLKGHFQGLSVNPGRGPPSNLSCSGP